jgi:hypothetical protein
LGSNGGRQSLQIERGGGISIPTEGQTLNSIGSDTLFHAK